MTNKLHPFDKKTIFLVDCGLWHTDLGIAGFLIDRPGVIRHYPQQGRLVVRKQCIQKKYREMRSTIL